LLTLHFHLPLATPVKAQSLDFEDGRSDLFVDFSFAEKSPRGSPRAPEACKLAVLRPGEGGAQAKAGQPGEHSSINLGAPGQFRPQLRQPNSGRCP